VRAGGGVQAGAGQARQSPSLTMIVMSSQRVRPEVAGPMTSSAKQSWGRSRASWIASSLRSSQRQDKWQN
jgi:hypothetical protein